MNTCVKCCVAEQVVYNAKNKMFVMYFEDRGPGLSGYTVAQSVTPAGPFKVTHYNVYVLPQLR